MTWQEIQRIEGFESEDFKCIRCGKPFHLYYNGGELDEHRCCGLVYATECFRVDLVIYEDKNGEE